MEDLPGRRHQQAAVAERVVQSENLQITSHCILQVVACLADMLMHLGMLFAFQASGKILNQDVQCSGLMRVAISLRAPDAECGLAQYMLLCKTYVE